MQPSNTIVQGSVSLRQALAAIGILVVLAIIVPIAGIMMLPAVALGAVARALVDAALEGRAPSQPDRVHAASTLGSCRPTRPLGAPYASPCPSETST